MAEEKQPDHIFQNLTKEELVENLEHMMTIAHHSVHSGDTREQRDGRNTGIIAKALHHLLTSNGNGNKGKTTK